MLVVLCFSSAFLGTFVPGNIKGIFNIPCIEPLDALIALDPSRIPASNDSSFLMYDENDISTAFNFYGQPVDDYDGYKSYSTPSLNCISDSLKPEYDGYKT